MKYVDVVLSAAISVYTKGWNAIALLEKKKKKTWFEFKTSRNAN